MKRNKCARKKYKMYSDRKAIVKLEVANNICNNKKKKKKPLEFSSRNQFHTIHTITDSIIQSS